MKEGYKEDGWKKEMNKRKEDKLGKKTRKGKSKNRRMFERIEERNNKE